MGALAEQLEVPEPRGTFMNIFAIKFRKFPHLASLSDPKLAVALSVSALGEVYPAVVAD